MNRSTRTQKAGPRRALLPQRWVVLLFTCVGIYATNLVYKALVNGAWRGGIVGAVLLAAAVYVVGMPLAASMWTHRARKGKLPKGA
ncbi:hypothetical protein [Alicyclobacillus sp. ALC3]|uniref:hypothetical protein n=1 Tax=Alicyclobacillus sp. ALC3 TaxID=2796143 RepID=UPI002378D67B|nr:hypothetical protein [Alicyclobacillus sp. ALC3]WDL95537.1 hypothetical protein JC200_14195 [Alicyclobacillus sp. ALC3]